MKLVAEPWDASADGYRVGEFPPPWVEWNDQYRDTVRDFWRASTKDGIRTLATRLAGSSDLYADDGRSPYNSINFVTSHDGFTLRDLVSYNRKHNEANGERNRDGSDNNRSWNCGEEGETDDPSILALRRRQAANLIATLCLSNGVPMLTAGDERGRTQRGNNNAYVQDNETSWVDWRPDHAWLDIHEITRTALRIRREHPALRQRHWFEGRPAMVGGPKDLAWIHPKGREMDGEDWNDTLLHVIGMFVSGDPIREPGPRGEQQHDSSFLLWLNGSAVDCEVTLPENEWVQHGAVVLSTDPDNPIGTEAHAGGEARDRSAVAGAAAADVGGRWVGEEFPRDRGLLAHPGCVCHGKRQMSLGSLDPVSAPLRGRRGREVSGVANSQGIEVFWRIPGCVRHGKRQMSLGGPTRSSRNIDPLGIRQRHSPPPPTNNPYANVTTPSSAGLARYACLGRTRTV